MNFKVLSPAKINLVLRIGRLRPDGFHDLASLMSKLDWGDEISGSIRKSDFFSVSLRGNYRGVPIEKNLVYRAAKLFYEKFGKGFELEVTLRKNIPTEAGLGGGSSNAATTLMILGKFFGISKKKLIPLASALGSDVPFFFSDENSAWCLGRGERFIEKNLPSLPIIVVRPKKAKVPTAWAYQTLDRVRGMTQAKRWKLDQRFPDHFENSDLQIPLLENDFESICFKKFPELLRLKNDLARSGASAGIMTGSGSCFFGIYANEKDQSAAMRTLNGNGWEVFPCKIHN